MNSTVIYDRNGWKLISYNNGGAYTLRQFRPSGSYSVFFQYGDDAETFRASFDACDDNGVDQASHLFPDYSELMRAD